MKKSTMKACEELRARANHFTPAERAKYHKIGTAIINGFHPKAVKEPKMMEGETYLAEIIKGHKSTVGKLVKVTLPSNVDIEWESGQCNTVGRHNIKIIGRL